jgi:peptidoglycan L-alanyl-D-glutamate endopeptidase CwlK
MANIEELRPKTRQLCKLWIEECRKDGINLLVTQTLRSMALQDAYFSQGRESLEVVNLKRKKVGLTGITEKENKIVTRAKPGASPHNYGLAWDFVPLKNNKACWDDLTLFKKCGEIAKKINLEGYTLEWGGDFKSIKDMPHIQLKDWKNYK